MQGPVRLPTHPQQLNPISARFGVFEVDFRAGQLRKHGLKLKLRGKPLRILEALLERPGELVKREDLRARLWPAELSVGAEHRLTIAVNKLRTALGDSAGNPRFIETVSRRGYRFIAPVNRPGAVANPDQGWPA